ncbi:esterase [Echinicola rosea]|uniref:Esterase n=2 Tax=Echinicola rosea TaxID=1807691 RepID=A0ABQ1V3C8_9BACT|nr:esterase [Echinicola rosea]
MMKKSQFRTTENSDAYSMDGLRFLTVKSKNLEGRADICLYVPEGKYTDLPMVTLLHGVYGSAWVWALKAGAHLVLEELIQQNQIAPMGLVMPSDGLWGDGSAYLTHHGKSFDKWIAEEVPLAAIENFECFSPYSPRFIAGLSMGGFGAMNIGARYGERYSGISGHSSITDIDQMALFAEESWTDRNSLAGEGNVFKLMQQYMDTLPPLRFDCGVDDELLSANRLLHRQLEKLGVKHDYQEFSGGHEWSYWNNHLRDTLLFFDTLLSRASEAPREY